MIPKLYHKILRIEALITVILVEILCVATLAYYLFAKLFSWNTRISQEDAIAALSIAVLALPIYGLFSLVSGFFIRKDD